MGEFKVPVEPQNRPQFIAIGTKGVEMRRLKMSFAPQRTRGNLPVHTADKTSANEEHCIKNINGLIIKVYQNNDRFSLYCTHITTTPSTRLYAACRPKVGHSCTSMRSTSHLYQWLYLGR